ncbi:hypothetical protein GFY24_26145 [Nocardia sp. SYP-A9097]|uniref:hypothetical protein n=1 Tax=Nocardia sp. SYP-A9097 TaxID=2663237 RepID=UPI00129A12B2|nr:hypothetical protein [Nocardia sp. SYP-A9097]MRH90878.1 hypothetical protein [Nocardia sp. SYP-A9097]
MLGSPQESHPVQEGDLDPRGLAAVVVVSGLMVLAIGAGMLLTGSGESGAADPAPRRSVATHQRAPLPHPPAGPANAPVAPAKGPAASPKGPPVAADVYPARVHPPATPHPVEAPVLSPSG